MDDRAYASAVLLPPILNWVLLLAVYADKDLAPVADIQQIDPGSLIIPMDNNLQGINGGRFNLLSYGLAIRALYDEIGVKWAIRTGKLMNEDDFQANVGVRVACACLARRFVPAPSRLALPCVPWIILAAPGREPECGTCLCAELQGRALHYSRRSSGADEDAHCQPSRLQQRQGLRTCRECDK